MRVMIGIAARALSTEPVRSAVIIAAGLGSRLQSLSASKPLARVCGIPLIEIAVRQLALAGIGKVVVVTGHEAEAVEAILPSIAAQCGIDIYAERVTDWCCPNGYSVIAGAAKIEGNYVLVMADHILAANIITGLLHSHRPTLGVTLAIDRQLGNTLIDHDDATFVQTDPHGAITAIGKHLMHPHAADCGAFLATPQLSLAIAAAIVEGRPGSLSDGMQWLADRGEAGTMEIGESWWIDVDDPFSHEQAERALAHHLPHLFETP